MPNQQLKIRRFISVSLALLSLLALSGCNREKILADFYYFKGILLGELGHSPQAIAAFDQALRYQPEDPDLLSYQVPARFMKELEKASVQPSAPPDKTQFAPGPLRKGASMGLGLKLFRNLAYLGLLVWGVLFLYYLGSKLFRKFLLKKFWRPPPK